MFEDEPADPATFRELREVFPSTSLPGGMFYLTCRNHPTARYLTKNPYSRGLHFIAPPYEARDADWRRDHGTGPGNIECRCPFSDLVVISDGG